MSGPIFERSMSSFEPLTVELLGLLWSSLTISELCTASTISNILPRFSDTYNRSQFLTQVDDLTKTKSLLRVFETSLFEPFAQILASMSLLFK